MAATQPVLEVKNLTVSVGLPGGKRGNVVENVSFSINSGDTLGLVGESGSGKTMASLAVMGLLPRGAKIEKGQILLDGQNLLDKSKREMQRIRGSRMAMVLQDPMTALDPSFTIRSQLSEPLRQHRAMRGRDLDQALVAALEQVQLSGAKARLRQFPHQLSGGMRQRVLSAMALAGKPRLLIADEPTTALDATTQARYLNLLRTLQETTGFALLLIAHDLFVVRHVCQHVMVMYASQVVEEGPVSEVFTVPKHPYTRALLDAIPVVNGTVRMESIEGNAPDLSDPIVGCRFGPRCKFVREVCRSVAPELSGREKQGRARCWGTEDGGWVEMKDRTTARVEAGPPPKRDLATSNEDLLQLRKVTVRFPAAGGLFSRKASEILAVDRVSLSVERGRTLGLVGGTGSGKSTVAHVIMGLVRPSEGSVTIAGQEYGAGSAPDRVALQRVRQVVLQDPYSSLEPRMRVRDIIAEPLTLGPRASRLPKEAVDRRVAELLELVGLSPSKAGNFPHQFSGGQRQRISIARALAPQPELIVLDEPTSALDVSVRAQILILLKSLQDTLGISYLIISHDLVTVAYLASTVAVMHHGRIVEIGPTRSIYSSPRHPYTLELLSSAPHARGAFLTAPRPGKDDSIPSSGCRFAYRCRLRTHLGNPSLCLEDDPASHMCGGRDRDQRAACHFPEKLASMAADETWTSRGGSPGT